MSSNNSGSSEAEFSHDTAGTKLWSVYVSEAEKYNKALVDSWKSDMEGLLIFAGLFSAILTAFLIESYKTLIPDSADEMKALLSQISTQLSGIANGSSVDLPAPGSFFPPTSSVVCNLLWFISLGLSLSCALIATLVEQWARDFKYKTEMHSAPVIRARISSYLYYGLKRFNMHAIVEIIPFLLHTSLILFFAGLVAFLAPVNTAIMITVIILLSIVVIAYTMLTVFPLFSSQSPYQTPISSGLWRAIQLIRSIWPSTSDRRTQPVSMVDAMNKAALEDSDQRAHRDYRALSWTLKSLSDDVELEPFLEGIVDALATTEDNWMTSGNLGHHGRSPYDEPIRRLLQSREARLLQRVHQFLRRCEITMILPDTQAPAQTQARRRQLIALESVWAMATIPAKRSTSHRNLLQLEPFHFHFPPPRSPVNEHKLSVVAVLRLNMFLNAMHIVNTTIDFLNNQQSTPEELLVLLVTKLVDIVDQYFKHRSQTLDSRWSSDRRSLDQLTRAIRHFPRDFGGRFRWFAASEPFAGGQVTLNSLHQSLIYKGHEDFLEFMVNASRLVKPPYQFRRTEKLLLAWFDRGGPGVSPDIAPIYSDAFNKVIDYQCHEDASYKPHVDNILAALLELLVHFQETGPDSTVSFPSNLRLSLYFMKPYFDPSKLHVFRDCNKWWLCWCLTMELATVPPHVHSESTEQILRAMWEVAADKGTRFRGYSSPPTPSHPSQCMLEALHEITEYPESISIIALVQTAILNDTSLRSDCEHLVLFGTTNEAPANSTPRLEDPLRIIAKPPRLSILDMCVGVVAKFIRQASTLHSPPYKVNETMSVITHFVPHPPGVSPSQQLNFATSWKTALWHDSPEGFPATLLEIISTCPLLQMYWDRNTTQFRWLDDCEAATVFIEGIDITEGWEEISPISRTRLAAIRESLMTVADVHGGGIGESTIATIDLEALNISW